MSGATGTTAIGGQAGGATPPSGGLRLSEPALLNLVITAITVVALVFRWYLLDRSGVRAVTQYDDGPYFGSAVRLVHGVLPYRDYAFVQPPGITVLMGPAGLLSYLTGTAGALVVARVICVICGAASVVFGGLLVRHRGPLAVVLVCGILALYPPLAIAARTVLLEPYLVLFCLAGAVAVFDGDKVTASARRLIWGGVAFGFAGSVKAWAIVPVLVVVALCLPQLRRAAVFAGGVAAGFLVTVLPFAVTAPRLFFTDVVVSQLSRAGTPTPVWHRLGELIGLSGAQHWPHGTLIAVWAVLAGGIAAAQIAAWLVTRCGPGTLDWFATVSLVLVVAMFLWPPYFAAHYAAFLGPFLALAVALPVARLVTGLITATGGRRQPEQGWATHRLAVPGLVLALLAIVAGAVVLQPASGGGLNHAAAASKVIPPGACVATDQASFLLLANRFISNVPGCSQMVDGLGTDLALASGRRPDTGAGQFPAVRAAWNQAFSHAGYVLLSRQSDLRIPWTPQLTGYFHSHFRLVLRKPGFTVYARDHA